jgi:hypothetical protein
VKCFLTHKKNVPQKCVLQKFSAKIESVVFFSDCHCSVLKNGLFLKAGLRSFQVLQTFLFSLSLLTFFFLLLIFSSRRQSRADPQDSTQLPLPGSAGLLQQLPFKNLVAQDFKKVRFCKLFTKLAKRGTLKHNSRNLFYRFS